MLRSLDWNARQPVNPSKLEIYFCTAEESFGGPGSKIAREEMLAGYTRYGASLTIPFGEWHSRSLYRLFSCNSNLHRSLWGDYVPLNYVIHCQIFCLRLLIFEIFLNRLGLQQVEDEEQYE